MKYRYLLISFTLFLSSQLFGQQMHPVVLKSGNLTPAYNISQPVIDSINQQMISGAPYFVYLQFAKTPLAGTHKILSTAGIELISYLPTQTYYAAIHQPLSLAVLKQVEATAIFQLLPKQKIHPALASGNIPAWAETPAGTVHLWIKYAASMQEVAVSKLLADKQFEITDRQFSTYHILGLKISRSRLTELASLDFIEYLEPVPHPDQALNAASQAMSAARVLKATTGMGGKNLDGTGVVVGVGDNANILSHVDFSNRVIDRAATGFDESHGKHTSGTVGGAGIREPIYEGYAPGATILSQTFSKILSNAPLYVSDHGMVITNNSYGAVAGDCNYAGLYDLVSHIMDQQAYQMPNLQHVFAAGNDGTRTCPPYATGFRTVLGSYQSAKNVITVGGTNYFNSSKGPVQDGRLKPEIMALGTGVISTGTNNGYFSSMGTSMAAPAVSGGLALLYQQYRQLHGNSNPKSGLMKALLCNGASDAGNTGPDFKNGYGLMNLGRAAAMLENNRYFTSAVSNGNTNVHTINNVPANTAMIKVMLYWHDPAASPLAARTLVNDLDLEVRTPAGMVVYPLRLDTLAGVLNNLAITGADHINNIEQVVIDNPASGTFTFSVKGTAINQNPQQEYFLVYDFIPDATQITYPLGSESFLPGENILVSWDDAGTNSHIYTISISTDNGTTWADQVSQPGARQLSLTLPNTTTTSALVKVRNNNTGAQSQSMPFTIAGRPVVSLAPVQCESYINIQWSAVTGATAYEVMQLKSTSLQSIFVTPDAGTLSYVIGGLHKDSLYWVAVRAIIDGKPARRSVAISYKPAAGSCSGIISDHDLKIDALLTPATGRMFTSTALSNNETLSFRIKNLDDATATDFTVRFRINGSGWFSKQVTSGLAANNFMDVTFPGIDLSAAGDYLVESEVINNAATDPIPANNKLVTTISQLPNASLDLTVPLFDNLDAAPVGLYNKNMTGLMGLPRYDFATNRIENGRLRTFFSSGISYSGKNAFTLDATHFTPSGVTNFLTGTYNLTSYNALVDDIRLDFQFKHHGQFSDAMNKVWVRGNDDAATPWIEAYDLSANQAQPGAFKRSASLELGDLLASNGQMFSSSFQVRWGQRGVVMAADNTYGNGYTFDDIQLYKAIDDIQMLSIDSPQMISCGLGASTQVAVTVRNSANHSINNIPVRLRLNNGAIISETIATISANQVLQFIFTTRVDLSAFQQHTLSAWVDLASDNFRANDTTRLLLNNLPIINTFPYLQDFESGNGNWYTSGTNNSWEYGTPASAKINRAASGSKAWKTRLSGHHNDEELSFLYSPCYNISGLSNPTLSFSVALDLEDCGTVLCDAAYVEYSVDGKSWMRLGNSASGTNWYNKNYSSKHVWSVENYTRWHVATIQLPTGLSKVNLRIVMQSDPGVNREGIAIDDIHIYDNTSGIYNGVTMPTPATKGTSGDSWVHFEQNGKLVASILPAGQDLGSTAIQGYMHQGATRFLSGQYFHNRNITIKPTTKMPLKKIKVRYYFTDTETEALIKATGCTTCSKPASAYELGVSKYSGTDPSLENGDMHDNGKGHWEFINKSQRAIVPFDIGYYAEFEVNDFSEFWLNDGGLKGTAPVPVNLQSFTAEKSGVEDVNLKWTTDLEVELNRFEIELARGNENLQLNQFEKIATVAAKGNSTSPENYGYTDKEAGKNGARYYRLKMIDEQGRVLYSGIRSVVFENPDNWKIYPNPSAGMFFAEVQVSTGQQVQLSVTDVSGRVLKRWNASGTGLLHKYPVNLEAASYPAGLYFITIETGSLKRMFKAVKQ